MNKVYKKDPLREIIPFSKFVSGDDAELKSLVDYTLYSANSAERRYELLNALLQNVPDDLWVELSITYLDSLKPENQKDICSNISSIICDGVSRDCLKRSFRHLEKATAPKTVLQYISQLLETASREIYRSFDDRRYKLFADFAWIYSTSEIEKLQEAVRELDSQLKRLSLDTDKRNVSYVFAVALQRLCIAEEYGTDDIISGDTVSYVYEKAIRQNDECCGYDYSNENGKFDDSIFEEIEYRSNFHTRSACIDIADLITKYNCPEIVRIFDTNCYYYDGNFILKLHNAAKEAIENARYSSEADPIVSKKVVFLS